ncbi:FG-GAP-like repeat-containing protein [Cognataquiflexum rubidum]|uniref:FG-GAP-like repeat-containing protein n=1 Tax=Cognataquiflexum rubidum TaxID=2922273 RepID=UPI001F128C9E|nr:FG-GAP-like repeat-containing protein [Cognataquiflexum rubidum]MCH6234477.1 FG-GAP-like repeat-containing protein [Cognataquiflexum rubidum]
MKYFYFFLLFISLSVPVLGQSEPSTYFNIYVPPNNEAVQRNVALILTAVSDSTLFSILDDDMDGDSDDSVSGMLMSGQSYILYIKDNGVNDDALYASGGTLASNGDYYIINSDKLIYASMSTDSDWQHDFVPSVNKKTVGQKFFVYSPKVSNSPRDLNVFAYQENTTISIFKISSSPTTQTGYTNIDLAEKQLVVQKTISPGQDIIHYSPDGRDIMQSGGTYLIESNKDISVQYGALWGNARDGGAYVPSSNGSGSGELFYFAVPYQSGGEQEIRIASWDNANEVVLSRYQNGTWITMNNWTLNELQPADWVGKQNGNVTFPTVFRVTCSPGKRVSVMEANWMETGSTNTSDMSTMLSSEAGTSSGKRFLAYMLPPSRQNNVINPFTKQLFQGSISHFYLFAGNKNTSVTIKDAKTKGQVLNKTYQIEAGRYADAFFTMDEWKSVYNGTGTPVGPDRPYVIIESTERIAILSTNFNDNWMNYFGTSLPQSFTQSGSLSNTEANPGQEVTMISTIEIGGNQVVENATIEVKFASGLIPLESSLKKNDQIVEEGVISSTSEGSTITFSPLTSISSNDNYSVETTLLVASTYNDGSSITNETVLSVETVVSGTVEGEFQQSYLTQGIQNNASNTSNLFYSACQIATIASSANNSWNPSWADYNNDGHEDLFIATKDVSANNELYRNNGNGTFTKITNHPLVNEKTNTVAAVWADINNDGRNDVLLVNATQHKSKLFLNNGNGNFSELKNSGIDPDPQYFHGAAFADFDNDGFVDLIMTNFFQTRFHQLYRNNGNNKFSLVTNTPVTLESERSMAPILADYNNDGLVDIFIPNGNNRPNSLFKNLGNFQFEKVKDKAIEADAKNSVGAAWGDFNNDGFIDLLVTNASGQNNDLYQNKGNGTFEKLENSIVSLQGGDSHGAAWFDVNNDGTLDLFITNDNGPSFLYINNGQGGFTRKLEEIISGKLGNSYGIAIGDYNKDGQLDMAVSTHTNGNTRFFCHNENSNRWIGFQLQGEYSNKQALGARVAIKSNGQWQYRQNLPLSGFGSQSTHYVHFGIGATETVDSVQVIWPSGTKQIVFIFGMNQYNMVLEEGGKKISGAVYHDQNKNGIQDEDEKLVANIRLNFNDGKINMASNDNGQFEFYTNEESLKATLNQPQWTINPKFAQFQVLGGPEAIEIKLPVNAVQIGHDLSVQVATTAWRRGFTNETIMQISNLGTEKAENVLAYLKLPEEAYLTGADKEFTSPSPKTYTWELGTLDPGSVRSIQITDSIGLAAQTGQLLLLEAYVASSGKDINEENNKISEEIEVVGAIDPNDILVSPKGDGPEGYIRKNQSLSYTIRFENMGTYKATYVRIENELPEWLDLNTFELSSSSHPFTYSLSAEGKLDVSYRNIDLPPAMLDSIGAHGYFKYTIRPKTNIPEGTQLPNDAKIYFDFEDPIVTNTVINTIKFSGETDVKSLKIYPNPATDRVMFNIEEDPFRLTEPQLISYWEILDATGKIFQSGREDQVPSLQIQVGYLPKGLYFIRASNRSGKTYSGKLLKQ